MYVRADVERKGFLPGDERDTQSKNRGHKTVASKVEPQKAETSEKAKTQ
jgi:hypothetical protein